MSTAAEPTAAVPAVPERILLVDDDQHLLDALLRQYRRRYDLKAVSSARAALEVLRDDPGIAVIVTDCNMPEMDGVTLLGKVRDIAPHAVRVMLTGNADHRTALDAVNKGHVFSYLIKPIAPEEFARSLDDALDYHRLRQAERRLLEQTLQGSIQMLVDVMAMVHPEAFGRAKRLHHYVRGMVAQQKTLEAWKYETAALLCEIGLVAVPSEVLARAQAGQELAPHQREMIDHHPKVAHQVLCHVPRLEEVAAMIERQNQPWNGQPPADAVERGARLLALARAYDDALIRGLTQGEALKSLLSPPGRHDPAQVQMLRVIGIPGRDAVLRTVPIEKLRLGMILDEDLRHESGALLVARNQEVTASMLARLFNYHREGVIPDFVRVRITIHLTD